MVKKSKKAFTLVELIVVITIIAILGTIAFISLQGYSLKARDSKRVSDVSNIKTSLELFILNTAFYPQPDVDGTGAVYYSGELLWTQGTIGNNVATNLSKNLQSKPVDPLFDIEYTYSVASSNKEYQLMALYEGELSKTNSLLNNSYAANTYKIKVEGTYNELFLKTLNYIIPLPSLIISEDLPVDFKTNTGAINSMVVTDGTNIPNMGVSGIRRNTGSLDGVVLSPIGAINSKSSSEDKVRAINAIQNTYKGSSLALKPIYKNILDKTNDEDKIITINSIVLKTIDKNIELPTYTCATQPTYVNATFTSGTATEIDQTWQKGTSGACYFECINDYTGDECEIAPVYTCDTNPGYTNATYTEGTPTVSNQSWQNTNGSNPCYFSCNANYTWNGSSCNANTQSVSCGGSIVSNATASTAGIYTQTWNGSSWTPTTTWGISQATCDFNCNTNYTWNGSSCQANTQTGYCYGFAFGNSTPTGDQSYTQTWDGDSWEPQIYLYYGYGTCGYDCINSTRDGGSACIENSCAAQPGYTYATFSYNIPMGYEVPWQNYDFMGPCYYECTEGYTGEYCDIPPEGGGGGEIVSLVPILTGPSSAVSYSSQFTGTPSNSNGYAWMAFDGLLDIPITANSWWVNVADDPYPWISYDFSTLREVTSYTITPCVSGGTMAPNAWALESSYDGNDWIPIDFQSGISFAGGVSQTFNISSPSPAIMYRFSVSSVVGGGPGQFMMIPEIEFFGY